MRPQPPATLRAVWWMDIACALAYGTVTGSMLVGGVGPGGLAVFLPAAGTLVYVLLAAGLLRRGRLIGLLQITVSALQVLLAFILFFFPGSARMFATLYAVIHVPHLVLMLTESTKAWYQGRREQRDAEALAREF